jgi:hypothetical protein
VCEVKFDSLADYVPFGAMAADPAEYGRRLYAELLAARWGKIGPYVPPPPTPDDRYVAAIASGMNYRSTATPALDGTYDVGPAAVRAIQDEAQFIALYGEFASGQATLDWPDMAGTQHTFTDTAQFMDFAKAVMRYVADCRQARDALRAGRDAAFPGSSVSG